MLIKLPSRNTEWRFELIFLLFTDVYRFPDVIGVDKRLGAELGNLESVERLQKGVPYGDKSVIFDQYDGGPLS